MRRFASEICRAPGSPATRSTASRRAQRLGSVRVGAAPRVATFRPQHLANLVWSYGTLGAHDPALFAAVEAEAVARMAAFDAQAVANAAKRVFVLAAAAVFLGEVPSARKIVGSCVALLGVLGYGLSKRDAAKKNR